MAILTAHLPIPNAPCMVHYGVHVGNFSIHGASGHQWGYWNGECTVSPHKFKAFHGRCDSPSFSNGSLLPGLGIAARGSSPAQNRSSRLGWWWVLLKGDFCWTERGLKHQKSGENGGIIWCNEILMGKMFEAFVTIELMSVIDLFWSIYFRVKSCRGKCLSSENLIHMR